MTSRFYECNPRRHRNNIANISNIVVNASQSARKTWLTKCVIEINHLVPSDWHIQHAAWNRWSLLPLCRRRRRTTKPASHVFDPVGCYPCSSTLQYSTSFNFGADAYVATNNNEENKIQAEKPSLHKRDSHTLKPPPSATFWSYCWLMQPSLYMFCWYNWARRCAAIFN